MSATRRINRPALALGLALASCIVLWSDIDAQASAPRYDFRTPTPRRDRSVGTLRADSVLVTIGAAREGGYPQIVVSVVELGRGREFYAEIARGDARLWAERVLDDLLAPMRRGADEPPSRVLGTSAVDFVRDRALGLVQVAAESRPETFRIVLVRDDAVYANLPMNRTELLRMLSLFVSAIDVSDSLSVVNPLGSYQPVAPLMQLIEKARTP